MKKVLFLASFILSAGLAHGQYLKPDGTFINSTGTLGYCDPSGVVQDKTHTIIGYINTDGTVQDKTHTNIGYVKTDGTMQDKTHTAIAYFNTAGYVSDASHKLIAQMRTQTEASLKIYFFP